MSSEPPLLNQCLLLTTGDSTRIDQNLEGMWVRGEAKKIELLAISTKSLLVSFRILASKGQTRIDLSRHPRVILSAL